MYLVLLENEEKLMSEVGLRTYIRKHVVTLQEIDRAILSIKETTSFVGLQDIGLIAKRIPIQFSLTHALTKEVSVMTEEVFEMLLAALNTGEDRRMVEHFLFVLDFEMQGVLRNHEINLIIPEYDSIFFDVEPEEEDDCYCCECDDTHDWEVNEEDIPRKDTASMDMWNFILDNAHEVRLFLEELDNSMDDVNDSLDSIDADLDCFDEELDEIMANSLDMKIEIAGLKFANKELESRNLSILARLAALEATIYSNYPPKWPANVPYYTTTTTPGWTISNGTTTADLNNMTYLASSVTNGSTAIATHHTHSEPLEIDNPQKLQELGDELAEFFKSLGIKVTVTGTKQESE